MSADRPKLRGRGSLTPDGKFLGYWRWDGAPNSRFAKLEAAYNAGILAADSVKAKKAALAKAGTLTEKGMKEALANTARSEAIEPLRRARYEVNKTRAEIEQRRSKLTLRKPDPSDISAALLRMEMRAHLAALKPTDRIDEARKLAASDPAWAEAIFTAPAALSGLPPETHQDMMERAIQAQHADEIAAIEELEEAVNTAERALDQARDEVRKELGLNHPAEFQQWAEPIELEVDKAQAAADEAEAIAAMRAAKQPPPVDVERLLANPALLNADVRSQLRAAMELQDHRDDIEAIKRLG